MFDVKCLFFMIFSAIFWPSFVFAQSQTESEEASAQTGSVRLMNFPPIEARLATNLAPEICEVFLAAEYVPDNPKATISSMLSGFQARFPDAVQIRSGFGPDAIVPFDVNNDGDEEVLYFEYEDSAKRPGTKTIYLYETQADANRDVENDTDQEKTKAKVLVTTLQAHPYFELTGNSMS